ncbi:tape measure protein [Pelagibacterium lentulum]|uniref:Tape measure protein N-terminal domain-containing protein n=1 Tax=Pelagibacterium lentulum TaxID=2029865 RepID=A0A916RP68_9HYPH|nr:tape measure protein [Pelagibacterium lentulum]GGA63937.1 hypothetical protein GCM10011499_37930 [Pelagibacterium lentulum]
MSDDQERLVVLFEARLRDFERRMSQSVRHTRQTRQQIERESAALAKKLEQDMAKAGQNSADGIRRAFGSIRSALGFAGIGLGAAGIANLTSEWTDLNARVANATGSLQRGTEVMGRLSDMARRTYSSLTQTTEAFVENSDVLTELGYNYTQQLDLTEALNNALVISATRGQRAESVMRAWSNAMALGQLSGQNLNTILQGSPRLVRALADSMGVGVSQLRAMGAAGQITARDMYGVTQELETLRAEADAMPATLQDSFVLLGNAVMQFVGQADQATGITGILAREIILLADSIEESARRWERGDVPILQFMQSVVGLSRELGLIQGDLEDTRTEVERVEDSVAEARLAFVDLADAVVRMQGIDAINPNLPQEIQSVVDKLLLGEMSAVEARQALLDLGAVNMDFGGVLSQLATLAGQLRVVTSEAHAMHAALNTPGGPTGGGAGRGGAGQSRRAAADRQAALTDYTLERERVLGLSREQLTLEQAITREIENAAKAGVSLSQERAEELARMAIAQQEANRASSRSGGRSGNDELATATKSIRERTEALMRETALQAQLNPLIDDYGYAMQKLRIQQELENAAAKAGLVLTPDRIAAMDQLADGYARASVEAAKLAETQNQARQSMEDWFGLAKTAARSFIDDLAEAKTAAEALGNALKQLGSHLINLGMNSLFGSGGGDFGLLGNLIGIPGRQFGGRVTKGQPYIVGEKRPELFVPDQSGTIVPRVPSAPDASALRGLNDNSSSTFTYAPTIDARGADVAAVARIEQVLARDRAEFEGKVRGLFERRNKLMWS